MNQKSEERRLFDEVKQSNFEQMDKSAGSNNGNSVGNGINVGNGNGNGNGNGFKGQGFDLNEALSGGDKGAEPSEEAEPKDEDKKEKSKSSNYYIPSESEETPDHEKSYLQYIQDEQRKYNNQIKP